MRRWHTITLPDKNDVHVVAIAIAAQAKAKVTYNGGHFPDRILTALGLCAGTPDEFCSSEGRPTGESGSWPPRSAHHVVAELARIGEVWHLPAVEVVLGHAFLGEALE